MTDGETDYWSLNCKTFSRKQVDEKILQAMKPDCWHRQTITMLRALTGFLCLGIVSFAIAADHSHDRESAGTAMQLYSDTALATEAHVDTSKLQANSHRIDGNTTAMASVSSTSMGHQAGNHEAHCQMPCDSAPSCSSLCALACSPAAGSVSLICASALPLPISLASLPSLHGINTFVGIVSPPLYRPPIHLT